MTTSTLLPQSLWPIRNAVIQHVHAGKNPPLEISQIYAWLEGEGWDELVGEGSKEEMVIDISRFCENDSELRAIHDLDDLVEITDQMRVNHSRDLLAKVISGEDDYDYPTVVFYTLEGSDGKSVVICGTLNIQPGGWDVEWDGVFLTSAQFLEGLKLYGIYLIEDIDSIDDASIISFWNQ